MDCADVRAALSARLDGEDSPIPEEIVDAHVAECEDCQAWYAQVTALGRSLRLSVDPPQPGAGAGMDMAKLVLDAAEDIPEVGGDLRRRQFPLLFSRIVLATLAVVYFVWAGVLLAGSTVGIGDSSSFLDANSTANGALDSAQDPLLARFMIDAAVSRFALGAGLAWAAWAPRAAGGLLPVYLGMWAFGGGMATRDIVMGLVGGEELQVNLLWTLLAHLLAVVALVMCWLSHHHAVRPLRESWRMLTAKPMNFSAVDAEENSSFWPGDHGNDHPSR